MKEFFEELSYMCSANNTKSRGLYLFITIGMALLALGIVATIVMIIINAVANKVFLTLPFVLLIFMIICLVGIIVWLKKS